MEWVYQIKKILTSRAIVEALQTNVNVVARKVFIAEVEGANGIVEVCLGVLELSQVGMFSGWNLDTE